MSGEHLVTKALFPGGYTIRGFPWCATEFKTVGVNALTANILCRRHNTDLSPLDAAAKDVWCVLRYIWDMNAVRQAEAAAGIRNRRSRVKFRLDGTHFERWAFKTMVNMVASGNVTGFGRDWEPPRELARHIVEGGALPEGCGLGLAVVIGEKVSDQDHISFALLRREDRPADAPEVEGFLMSFRGLRLAASSTRPLQSLHTPVNLINPEQVMLRPQRLELLPSGEVTLDWSGTYRNGSDKNVVRARKKYDSARL